MVDREGEVGDAAAHGAHLQFGLGFWVLAIAFFGFWFQVLGLGIRVSGFGFRLPGSVVRLSCLRYRVPWFGFQFRVAG